MGKLYETIDEQLTAFIKAQHMFFVASAPLSKDGHVNVSPKGLDSFAILSETKVAYLDIGGSGIETHAHAQENGRITIMFCAFNGKADIVRLYGRARVYDFNHPEFADKLALFSGFTRARAVIEIDVTRIADSCGWGVPRYEYQDQREQLVRWSEHMKDSQWQERCYENNATSIDGLPGLIRLNSEPL